MKEKIKAVQGHEHHPQETDGDQPLQHAGYAPGA
jgi:hypothetical protein